MNYPIIFRLLGLILGAMAAAFLGCWGIGWLFTGNPVDDTAQSAFLISTGLASFLAGVLLFLSKNAPTRFFRKEALCVIGLGWISASLVGAVPYMLILNGHTVADAIFESASGLTTTGASVLSNLEDLPRSLIFWRSLSQWIGGMGVVVFFVAILSFLGAGGKILFSNESTGQSADLEHSRVRKGVLQLFLIYLALSNACFFSLWLVGGMSWFDAICHSFTTVATGGFSTRSESIAAFQSPLIEWIMIVFMMLGATSFFVLLMVWKRNWDQFKQSTEVFAYYGMVGGAVFFFFFFLQAENISDGIHHGLRAAAFQVVSISTTSGFASEDFDQWPLFCRMAMLALMVIGGCSASTAGGFKMIRVVIGSKIAALSIERSFRTNVVRPVMVNGRPLDADTRDGVMVYFVLIFLILLASVPLLALFETGHSLEGAVSAVTSCFFNIGPGFAEFGATENFSSLTSPGKILLSLLMIMGRIELFAVLVLFLPSLWKKFS